ncbi:ParA family protein [Nocardia wallacei]|uniref:ParA family protein n=1 Tax=Nocardia wallacei TaxID=480035 RepID=UPI002458D0A6|nr:ParA family protein [Nocardia wallacei]
MAERTCRTIAIAMQKGGVGKTTSTINLAATLATEGLSVLVIDIDQQAHSTSGLGVELGEDDVSIYEVLHSDRKLRVPLVEAIKHTEFGVDVVPSDLALKELEDAGLGPGGQLRLARQLDTLTGYDVVLIDCPPALGTMTETALMAADDVLAVLEAGPDEVKALIKLGYAVLDVQEGMNDGLDIRYVLLADYEGNTKTAQNVREGLIRDWGAWADGGAYLGEIPHTVKVREAKDKGVPIAVHAPVCSAAVAYKDAGRRLAERIRA